MRQTVQAKYPILLSFQVSDLIASLDSFNLLISRNSTVANSQQ